jgi:hypothetical protein
VGPEGSESNILEIFLRKEINVRFEVFKAVTMKNGVF